MGIRVTNFGYKFEGPPPDATLVIDCRVIPNPYGQYPTDEARWAAVLRHPMADSLINQGLIHIGDQIINEQDAHVAYGCAFGRHRSRAVAEELKRRLADARSALA